MRAAYFLACVAALACTAHSVAACGTYTIRPGDTFWAISQSRGFSVDAIIAANPGVVPERLAVGQTVNLPCQGGGNNRGRNNNRGPQPQPLPQPQPSAGGSLCEHMLPHVNAARSRAGAGPVRCSGEMDRAAQRHSNDQARNMRMTHSGSDGSSAQQRVTAEMAPMRCGGGSIGGWENVAQNQPGSSAKTYFDQWMNSAGHRANILNRDLTHMGVAVASNGGKEYATQVFAKCT